nr:hypothetical protein [uncultured Oscillibacter sp.]
MGKMTFNLCEELHQRIRDDVAADETLTTGSLMERIIRGHYENPNAGRASSRTLAFQAPEELFQRVKRYLAAHGTLTQKKFVVELIDQAVTRWERGETIRVAPAAKSDGPTRTLAFEVSEELFQRVGQCIAAHKLTKKAFVLGLIQHTVDQWEASEAEAPVPA